MLQNIGKMVTIFHVYSRMFFFLQIIDNISYRDYFETNYTQLFNIIYLNQPYLHH